MLLLLLLLGYWEVKLPSTGGYHSTALTPTTIILTHPSCLGQPTIGTKPVLFRALVVPSYGQGDAEIITKTLYADCITY